MDEEWTNEGVAGSDMETHGQKAVTFGLWGVDFWGWGGGMCAMRLGLNGECQRTGEGSCDFTHVLEVGAQVLTASAGGCITGIPGPRPRPRPRGMGNNETNAKSTTEYDIKFGGE